MKLDYNILWIDDQPQNVSEARRYIESDLETNGFNLKVTFASDGDQYKNRIDELEDYHEYDLIMIDWDLGNQASHNSYSGDKIAKKVRKNTYTEIIFYSAKPVKELRKLIFDQNIDGVYSVNRDHLGYESMHIINETIKKILDVNSMRGIIVSSVGDFDHIIADCIRISHSVSTIEQRDAQIISIKSRITAAAESSKKKLTGAVKIDDLLSNYSFSTYIRLCELKSQLKKLNDSILSPNIEILDKFKEDIIDIRNTLAHARLIEENGIKKIEASPENITISDTYFTMARLNIIRHEKNLYDIRDKLSQRAVKLKEGQDGRKEQK